MLLRNLHNKTSTPRYSQTPSSVMQSGGGGRVQTPRLSKSAGWVGSKLPLISRWFRDQSLCRAPARPGRLERRSAVHRGLLPVDLSPYRRGAASDQHSVLEASPL